MLKRLILGALLLAGLGAAALAALAWRPAIDVITPRTQAFAPALVARGATLAAGGYCATCHTVRGGAPYAGGYAMKTGFGTIYSTNITPDPATGIGGWSAAAFDRALRQGVSRDGSHLFPALPYDHFTKLSDADVAALYAFIMTRPPVHAPARAPDIAFPLNVRALQAGWKLLFFKAGRYAPDPAHDAEWNRGAYLAEALGHCGACHTPRNGLGAEQRDAAYAGAPVDGWIAPALTRANPAPVPWTTAELGSYLTTGLSRYHGSAAGPMSAVVHDGIAKLTSADQVALTRYVASLGGGDARGAVASAAVARATIADRAGTGLTYDADARLFTAACASCHYNAGVQPNPLRPDLALNTAVNLDDPTNLIRVILYGVAAGEGAPDVVMPGFSGFSDSDVARLAAYIRRTRTVRPAWTALPAKVAEIRRAGQGES